MTIPEKVKIGGFTYRIERPSRSFVGGDGLGVLDGEHSFSDRTIKVATVGCEEYQHVVFLHEVCHAIISNCNGTQEQDENFVEQFSKGLYQFVVDNPQVFGGIEANDDREGNRDGEGRV